LVVLVAIVAVLVGVWSVRRTFPEVTGEAELAGLDASVEVLRDDLGVAHLYAETSADLYRAQGYVHAQERFWQMDVARHTGEGRLAEMFGPGQLETDKFLRTLGWGRTVEQELAQASPRARRMLTAYAEGVNAYLESRPQRAMSLEYAVLSLQSPGYRVEPWEPTDSLVFLKLLAFDLRANLEAEIDRAVLSQTLSDERIADLYPPYPERAPVITEPGQPEASPPQPEPDIQSAAVSPGAVGALRRVGSRLESVGGLSGAPAALGSNSWVVAGEHTATGAPILANDPHLGIQMPSTWYQIGLHCTAEADCRDDVAGVSIPSLPGVIVGHNDRIAWGLTNLKADVTDLYIERINPDDASEYEVDGEWTEMTTRREVLRAAGGVTETITVRATRHGPLVSEVYGPLEGYEPQASPDADGGSPGADDPGGGAGEAAETAVALRWTALEPTSTIEAIPRINRARNWTEFREAARAFEVPAQNLVYADVDGAIGYLAPGRIPVRAKGDGSVPVPGWSGEYDWTGFVPYDELPSLTNPEPGYIVTANNAAVGADYPYLLTTDWSYGARASRIERMLEQRLGGLGLDSVGEMQTDAKDRSANFLVPALTGARLPNNLDGADGPSSRQAIATARQLLGDWNRQATAKSPGAAVYAAAWRALLANTFHDELPEAQHPAGGARWFEVVRRLLDDPSSRWWDDRTTGVTERRDDILAASLADAVAELRTRLGDDPQQWAWGRLHTATFANGTLGQSGIAPVEALFNRGPTRTGGGTSLVNATSWDAATGYAVTAAPSMRMAAELGDLGRTRLLQTTGQSGHAYHPHYDDAIPRWRDGDQHQLGWQPGAIRADAASRQLLVPPER
jgi:penicillin amidase